MAPVFLRLLNFILVTLEEFYPSPVTWGSRLIPALMVVPSLAPLAGTWKSQVWAPVGGQLQGVRETPRVGDGREERESLVSVCKEFGEDGSVASTATQPIALDPRSTEALMTVVTLTIVVAQVT